MIPVLRHIDLHLNKLVNQAVTQFCGFWIVLDKPENPLLLHLPHVLESSALMCLAEIYLHHLQLFQRVVIDVGQLWLGLNLNLGQS